MGFARKAARQFQKGTRFVDEGMPPVLTVWSHWLSSYVRTQVQAVPLCLLCCMRTSNVHMHHEVNTRHACAEVSQLPAVSATNLMAGDMPRQLPDLLHMRCHAKELAEAYQHRSCLRLKCTAHSG